MPALRLRAALAVCGLAALLPVRAAAQDDRTARRTGSVDVPLLERSRIFKNIPSDKTGEVYEGLIALHFPVLGNMQDHYDTLAIRLDDCRQGVADCQRHVWSTLPSLSMIVNLRQTTENSAPVRTPSYMPRGRVTFVRTEASLTAPNFTGRLAASTQWVFEVTPIGHYSNGQDGCLFVGQDAAKDCTFAAPVADSALVVNRKDGSFSTHYIEGAVARRWLTWDDKTLDSGSTRHGAASIATAFVRVRDYSLYSGIGGGMEADLRRLYGTLRVRAGAEYTAETQSGPSGPWWISGWVEAGNGRAPNDVTRLRTSLELGKTFDAMGGTGVFARWYTGHDDYNLGFLQKINVLQIGITLGGERRPTYNR